MRAEVKLLQTLRGGRLWSAAEAWKTW